MLIQNMKSNKDLVLWRTYFNYFGLILIVWGFPGGSDGEESACNAGDPGSIPGSGRSPGEGNGCPLQYSCLENPMDRGACRLQSMGSQQAGHDWSNLAHTSYTNILLYILYNFSFESNKIHYRVFKRSWNDRKEKSAVLSPLRNTTLHFTLYSLSAIFSLR